VKKYFLLSLLVFLVPFSSASMVFSQKYDGSRNVPSKSIDAFREDRKLATSSLNKGLPKLVKTRAAENNMTVPFEMKVFIDDRYAFVDYTKLNELMSDLEDIYGLTVLSAKRDGVSSYNFTYLSEYYFFVLPNPTYGNLSVEEQQAIVRYINETRGTAFIMGDKDAYINIDTLNNITKPFGIEFLYGNVTDETNYDYLVEYPLGHVWTNTSTAKHIGNNGTFVVKMGSTTSLNISNPSLNNTWIVFHRILIGDNDTKFNNTVWGENVTYVVTLSTAGGGIAMIAGTSGIPRDRYWYPLYDNKEFLLRSLNASMFRDLAIVDYEVPTQPMVYGDTFYVNITVKNTENYNISDVHIGVEFSGAIELLNTSNIVNISVLQGGETRTVSFKFNATGASTVIMELKTWSDNTSFVGYQRRVTFDTVQLLVDCSLSTEYLVLTDYNETTIIVNITNPSSTRNATNVNVTLDVKPTYGVIELKNESLYYFMPTLENGTSKVIKWIIRAVNFSRGDTVGIYIDVTSNNFGNTSCFTKLFVFTEKFVIFDNYHIGYFSDKMSGLISMANEIFNYNVFIWNSTLDDNLLGNATLLVIPDIETNFTDTEFVYIGNYLDAGGGLLIMGSCQVNGVAEYFSSWQMDAYNNITERFGIKWEMGEAKDDTHNIGRDWRINLTSDAFGAGSIAVNITHGLDYVLYLSGGFLNISGDAEVILHGNPGTTYAIDPDGNVLSLGGESIVLMAGLYNETYGTKIIATGSTKMFFDGWPYPLEYENDDLLRRVLLWFRYYPDTEPPAVSISSPANDSWFSTDSITISWAGSDNAYLEYYELYRNSSLIAHMDASVNSYTITLPDGHWKLTIKAYDWAGNIGSTTIYVHVDTENPSVNITYPADNSWHNTTTIEIKWDAADNLGLSMIEIYVDGSLALTLGPSETQATLSVSYGTHSIKVVVYDKAYNTAEDEITVNIDTVSPTVSISSPGGGSWISTSTVTISWTGSDDVSLDRYEIYKNGSFVASLDASVTSYTISLSDGYWVITIRAYDHVGNTASDMVSIYVDTTPPSISITQPADDSWFNSTEIFIKWSASDNLGLSKVEVYVDSNLTSILPLDATSTTLNLSEGAHIIKVAVCDKVGHKAEDEIRVNIDTEPPSVKILSPDNESLLNTNSITVIWDASDEGALSSIEIYVDDALNASFTPNRNNYTLTLTDGSHTIMVKVYDIVGHSAYDEIVLCIDTISPEIHIESPRNGEIYDVGANVTISWNASDNYGVMVVRLYINETLIEEFAGSGSYTTTFEETGKVVITVEAVDYAGNSAFDSIQIEIREEEVAPPPTPNILPWIAVASIATMIVIVMILIWRKRRG